MSNLIGRELSGYRILEQIGQGGRAKVFKAYQPAMNRVVALKMLPDLYAQDETARIRFRQEAQIIASLEHPHILPVHDFGETEDNAFLVMRYLQAGNLKNLLAAASGNKLPLTDTALIISQIASALDYAHQKNIVHRDVKPSNILIDTHGRAFLTDFGVAKVLEATQELTRTGSTLGTPAYMSPEQAAGKDVDGRSDVYSLGIILFQMLTGKPPFEADTPYATIIAHINEPLPLPSSINPVISEAVEQVLLKALAKDREDRFQSCGQLAKALHSAVGEASLGEKVSSAILELSGTLAEERPAEDLTYDDQSLLKEITRERRKKKLVPWIIGSILIVIVSTFIILMRMGYIQIGEIVSEENMDVELAGLIVQGATLTAQAEKGTQDILISQITQNGTRNPKLTSAPPPTEALPTKTLTQIVTKTPEIADLQIFEPITLENYRNIVQVNSLPTGLKDVYSLSWAPDNTHLAVVGHENKFEIWNAVTRELVFSVDKEDPESVSWSPEGSRLAIGLGNGDIELWNTNDWTLSDTIIAHTVIGSQLSNGGQGVTALTWSPDGTYLVSGGADDLVRVWDTSSGSLIITFWGHESNIYGLDWSTERNLIASLDGSGKLYLWDFDTNRELYNDRQFVGGSQVQFSNNGEQIAVHGGFDDESHVYEYTFTYIFNISDKTIATWLKGTNSYMFDGVWSEDDKLYLGGERGHIRIYDLKSENFQKTLNLSDYEQIYRLSISKNNTLIASGDESGGVTIWGISTE